MKRELHTVVEEVFGLRDERVGEECGARAVACERFPPSLAFESRTDTAMQ